MFLLKYFILEGNCLYLLLVTDCQQPLHISTAVKSLVKCLKCACAIKLLQFLQQIINYTKKDEILLL